MNDKTPKAPLILMAMLIAVSLTIFPWVYIFSVTWKTRKQTQPKDVLANQQLFQQNQQAFQEELKGILKEIELKTQDRFFGQTFQEFLRNNPQLKPPKGFE